MEEHMVLITPCQDVQNAQVFPEGQGMWVQV